MNNPSFVFGIGLHCDGSHYVLSACMYQSPIIENALATVRQEAKLASSIPLILVQ